MGAARTIILLNKLIVKEECKKYHKTINNVEPVYQA